MLQDIDMSKLTLSEVCAYLIDVLIQIVQDPEVCAMAAFYARVLS